MLRQLVGLTFVMALCLAATSARGEQRGRGGARPQGGSAGQRKPEGGAGREPSGGRQAGGARKAPGGNWSEFSGAGTQHGKPTGAAHNASGTEGAAAGAAASNRKSPNASGEQGAAAGAAAANRKSPTASGAQGAAAGAAAANRNSPSATGAQGAAAGAAAANRNAPKATGAQGAAAGAAAANRNSPAATGAQGAAAGAAVANRSSPNVSGAEGAAAGAAVANRNSPHLSGAAGYAAVRNTFDRPDMYGQGWYGDHPGAWVGAGLATAAWAPATWNSVATYGGYGAAAPVSYDYGNNVTCVDGNVNVDGQSAGTAEEFSQQAADLAETGTEAKTSPTDQWLPLGVFAMVRNEQDHPQLILQLAINKQGVLRGNYTDEATDHTLPIHGAVDPQTKRVAFTVGDNTNCVLEAGLSNITQGDAPALIHKNGKTDRWVLVRLEQPNQAGK